MRCEDKVKPVGVFVGKDLKIAGFGRKEKPGLSLRFQIYPGFCFTMVRSHISVVVLVSFLSLMAGSCASGKPTSQVSAKQEKSTGSTEDSTSVELPPVVNQPQALDLSPGTHSSPVANLYPVIESMLAMNSGTMPGSSGREFSKTRSSDTKVIGYYAWWTRGAWIDLDLSQYDKLIFFSTTPGADGKIESRNGWPHAWVSLKDRTDSLDIPLVPTLALLDAEVIKKLFLSDSARTELISTALTLIEESGGEGLHLDIELFEPASDSLRNLFMAFTDSLATVSARHFPNAELSIFAPALQDGSLFELSRINRLYDEIMVQGYDLHWQTGPTAGPLSPLSGWEGANWHQIARRYEAAGIERERMVMTIPYYGYEWPVETGEKGSKTRGEGRIVTYARVDSLNIPDMQVAVSDRVDLHGVLRDELSRSPYYSYRDSTGWWQGWFEDRTSLEHKYDFVQDREMRGVAIFPIGYDAGLLDEIIVSKFGRRNR